MTTYRDGVAGDAITAALLNGGQGHMIVKAANQDVNDSTPLLDDTQLVVPLEANASYPLIWCLAIGAVDNGGGSEPHINTEYTWPDGATGFKFAQGPAYPGTATSDRENTTMVSAVHNPRTDPRHRPISLTSAGAGIQHHHI